MIRSMGSGGVKRAPKEAIGSQSRLALEPKHRARRNTGIRLSPWAIRLTRGASDAMRLAVRKGATSLVAMTSLRETVSNGLKPASVAPLH